MAVWAWVWFGRVLESVKELRVNYRREIPDNAMRRLEFVGVERVVNILGDDRTSSLDWKADFDHWLAGSSWDV